MASNANAVYHAFVTSIRTDIQQHRYPTDRKQYRDFFLEHLGNSDPEMKQHLAYISPNTGNRLYQGDVDHIVPQSIWQLLLPPPLNFAQYDAVLSNLMIRDKTNNRANDQALIREVKNLHHQGKLTQSEKERYVEICIELKPHALEGTPWVATGFSNLNRRQSLDMYRNAFVDIDGNSVDRYGRRR